MSDYTDDPNQCEAIQDDLAELALGVLSGRRRSEVLRHVESCSRCTGELERLSIVADALVHLAPEVEPPIGFEVRFAQRLHAQTDVHRHRHVRRTRRACALVAAGVVMVVLGFGLGAFVTRGGANDQDQVATADTMAANLTSHGHPAGEVTVSAGSPAWIFMTVNLGTWSGKVTCDVTLVGGKVETIGVFQLSGRYGAWGAPLKSPAGNVRSAQLIGPNGAILASAEFST
jgi:Putative zinc-finger